MNEKFLLQIMTTLETSGIKVDYEKLKKTISADPIMAKIGGLDTTASKQAVKDLANIIHTTLGGIFKEAGVEDFKISVKEIEGIILKQNANILASEKNLQTQKDNFHKRNMTNVDLEIRKREEQSKIFSNQLKAQMQEQTLASKESNLTSLVGSQKVQFSNSISTFLKDNTKLSDDLVQRLLAVQKAIKVADATKMPLLKQEFKTLKSEAQSLGMVGKTSIQKFISDLGNFTTFLGAGTLIMSGVNSIKKLVSTVVELDESLTNLQIATGDTREETAKLLDTYIELGQQLGATGTDVAAAADVWLRQGQTIADTNTLITDSMILSKLGQIESADSTKYLTSAMQAYKTEAEDVIDIVDKLTAVDLVAAVSSGGLAEAMSRTSASAQLAGVSMDKLLGYIATVGEVTQKEMTSIGESFKTIFARMGNVKLGKMVDEEGNDITTEISDVETILNKVDIKLRSSATEFNNFGDILDQVGANWENFTEVEQSALATTFAGVRQRENFIVLMQQYDKALEYTTASEESAGTATAKFASWQESLAAKTDKLTASWQELALETLDSDFLGWFIELADSFLNIMSAMGGLTIPMATLTATFILWKTGLLKSVIAQIGALIIAQNANTTATVAGTLANLGFAGSIKAITTAMATFLATNPYGWIVLAVGALVGTLASANVINDAFNVSLEESKEKLSELSSEYEDAEKVVSNLQAELDTCREKLEELNDLGGTSLADQEQTRELEKQTQELERQLTIAKEKTKLDKLALEEATISTLKTRTDSSYDKTYSLAFDSYMPQQVTEIEELQNAIEKYNELQIQIESLNKVQDDLTMSGKSNSDEYKNNTKTIADLSSQMLEARSKANTLSLSLQEQADSIFGVTDEGKKWKKELNRILSTYTDFINKIEGVVSDTSKRQSLANVIISGSGVNGDINQIRQVFDTLRGLTSEELDLLLNIEDIGQYSLQEVIDKLREGKQAKEDFNAEPITFFSETETDAISKFKTDLSSVKTAYQELKTEGSLSSDSLLELQTTFADFDWSNFLNGSQSIEEVMQTLMAQIYMTAYHAVPALSDSFTTMYEEAFSSEVVDRIKGIFDTLDFKYDMDLTSDESYWNQKLAYAEKYYTKNGVILEDYLDEYRSIQTGYHDWLKEQEEKSADDKAKADEQALEDAKTAMELRLDELKHNKTMGMSDKEYYSQLNAIRKDMLKDYETYRDSIWSIDEEIYEHQIELAENAKQARIDSVNEVIENYKDGISEIQDEASNLPDGSNRQFAVIATGTDKVAKEIDYIEKKIKELNKAYANDTDNELYVKQLDNLYDALGDARDAQDDLLSSMQDALEASKENTLDELSKAYEKQVASIEKARDAFNDYTDARLKALRAEKDAHDYQKSITEKTDEISGMQKRIADLTLASKSGDRSANKELEELQSDLADKQAELDEEQYDHEIELKENAIDEESDKYNEMIDNQLADMESVYNSKVEKLETLYAKEEALIKNAANLTKTEFTTVFDELNAKIDSTIASMNKAYGSNVEGTSKYAEANIKNAQADVASDTSQSDSGTGVIKRSIIEAKLSSGTGTEGSSALNKWVKENYNSYLSFDEMVEIAKLLGVSGINSTKDVKGETNNRNLILAALKKDKFKTGGVIKSSSVSISEAVSATGEDVLIGANVGEGIITEESVKLLKTLGIAANNGILNKNLLALNSNLSNDSYTTNNSNPIAVSITVNGNADQSTVNKLKEVETDIVSEIMKQVRYK